MLAIMNSHYYTANVLLEAGANPNLTDKAGMGALYAAVDMSSLGEVYGLPPRKVKDTLTPTDLMSRLIAKGAIVDARLTSAAIQRNHTPGEPMGGTTPDARGAKRRLRGDAHPVEAGADPNLTRRKARTHSPCPLVSAAAWCLRHDYGTEADLREATKRCSIAVWTSTTRTTTDSPPPTRRASGPD
jgi:hypothetical protein